MHWLSMLTTTVDCRAMRDAGVLVGLICLGEQLPSSFGHIAERTVGWTCIVLGLTSLAGALRGALALTGSLTKQVPALKRLGSRLPYPLVMAANTVISVLLDSTDTHVVLPSKANEP